MKGVLALFSVASLAGACNPYPSIKCEQSSEGRVLALPDNGSSFSDVIGLVRQGRFEDLIRTAPPQLMSTIGDGGASYCQPSGRFARSTVLNYPGRRNDQVGAQLEIFYDDQNRVREADFQIIPLMP